MFTMSPERLSISLVSLLISFFDSEVNPAKKICIVNELWLPAVSNAPMTQNSKS